MTAWRFTVNGDPVEVEAPGMRRLLDVLREDTNRSGKLEWPAPLQAPENPCEKTNLPRFRSFAYQGRGDAPSRAVLSRW